MFFIKSRRYNRNSKFEKMLKVIRINNIIDELINILFKQYHEFDI